MNYGAYPGNTQYSVLPHTISQAQPSKPLYYPFSAN